MCGLRHMAYAVVLAFAFAVLLSGCADMTPRQKYWTKVGVGVLVVGAVAAHGNGASNTDPQRKDTHPVTCTNCAL